MNVSKMGDLHYALTLDTDPVERKLKIIGHHLTAMADELEMAKQIEENLDYTIYAAEPKMIHSRCYHCGKVLGECCITVSPSNMTPESIAELTDAVVKRLRDYYGLEV